MVVGAHVATMAVAVETVAALAVVVAAVIVLIEQQEPCQDYPPIRGVLVWRLREGSPSQRETPWLARHLLLLLIANLKAVP